MSVSSYERAIERMQKLREQNPYLQTAKAQTGALSGEFTDLQRKLDVSLRATGSPLAKTQATQTVGKQYESAIGGIYDKMDAKERERVGKINEQIDELEFRKDLAEEDKERRRKALADQKNQSLAKIAGTVVGAGIGFATGTGFAGAQIGAKIGGGLAGGISAATGYEADIEGMYEGLTDTISGFSDMATLQTETDLGDATQEFLKGAKNMSATELHNIQSAVNSAMTIQQKIDIYRNYQKYTGQSSSNATSNTDINANPYMYDKATSWMTNWQTPWEE